MALRQTPVLELSALLPGLGPELGSLPVSGLQLDSRALVQGDAFLAIPGEVHDGRNYLAAASTAGASVIIAEHGVSDIQRQAAAGTPIVELDSIAERIGAIADRFYGSPSAQMHLVGITGTNGKTTTSRLLAQLLRRQFSHCGVIGTLGATLGDSVDDAVNTTPDALALHQQLAEWRGAAVGHAVLEVSSHSLVQGRVNGLAFDTAVFTNLTHDHLDYHGDMENYGLAKSVLFRSPGLGAAVINMDDPFSARLVEVLEPSVELLGYSICRGDASVSATDIVYHDSGLEARVSTPWGEGLLHSPLAGDFNLANMLAAISAACIAGMPLTHALDAAPGLTGVAGRMEYVPNSHELQLVVDYAHTPDALQQALEALRAHTTGRLICVFGCGGDRDADKRALMGRIASDYADRVIITSDNPRNEEPGEIIADIQSGAGAEVEIEADRARAIELAVLTAAPGDCVLVAGKGHESYQQIGAERLPFSDVAQMRLALTQEGAQ
jgi:UDP-N-acetylmuramoyl-L-alanyl-D-glutamate--2,6-diaminopimelate ligase